MKVWMRTIILAAFPVALGLGASAHEFHPLVVSRLEKLGDSGNYYLYLDGTRKGQAVVCAFYDDDHNLITSVNDFTDNLATKLIFLDVPKQPTSIECVYN
jgi:hypothetical protein